MNREELLKQAKPILFNTEMVKAILEGRKTVTRRLVKPQPDEKHNYRLGFVSDGTNKKDIGKFGFGIDEFGGSIQHAKPPFKKGDYLYVRETWNWYNDTENGKTYIYRANYGKEHNKGYWKPSLHMPKEAARIFLKITDVRVERLQDITGEQAMSEGTKEIFPPLAVDEFRNIWKSTIKTADLDKYGWEANPWVWVIEFERVEV